MAGTGMRAALYLRVSTTRQAEQDLSLPDQQSQCEAYAKANGYQVTNVYIEPGASGTDDRRPAFQEMIADARQTPRPFDVVLVHSLSRFARSVADSCIYRRMLEKNDIRLVAITQDYGDETTSNFLYTVVAAFDEQQSAENAKHTLRAMKENARQGFWNGASPPYGYRTYTAELRGAKEKKRLEIDPNEAQTVKLIFDLYRNGDGKSGPLGIKAIVNHLGARGLKARKGARFSIKKVHETLRNPAYRGEYFFNRFDSRSKKEKPREEWIALPVPVIIEPETFETVQSRLKARSPRKTPARITNGPTLLTGLLKCGRCGAGITIRTGKGGRYRYYDCANKIRHGSSACKGHPIPMKDLDRLVVDSLLERILEPARLTVILKELTQRSSDKKDTRRETVAHLQRELRTHDQALDNLYKAVESGHLDNDESLAIRIRTRKSEREEIIRQLSIQSRAQETIDQKITPKRVKAFASALRREFANDNSPLRKSYLRLLIDRIEVQGKEVRITGSKAILAQAVAANDGDHPSFCEGVPTSMGGWRPQRESNPCLQRERLMS